MSIKYCKNKPLQPKFSANHQSSLIYPISWPLATRYLNLNAQIKSMIIGLTGTIGAGKSIVAEFLKKKGFSYFSLSNELREMAKKENIEQTRENLQNLGNKTRRENGPGFLAELVALRIESENASNAVIDGIRNPAEVRALKRLKNFFLVSIDADEKIRFNRLKERNRENDSTSWKEFQKANARDIGEKDENGQQTKKCMELADFAILNNSAVEEMHKKLADLHKKLSKE